MALPASSNISMSYFLGRGGDNSDNNSNPCRHQYLPAALVHKSADGYGAAGIDAFQAVCCDTGMPSWVTRLSTEQAALASVVWTGKVQALRPRPMMGL